MGTARGPLESSVIVQGSPEFVESPCSGSISPMTSEAQRQHEALRIFWSQQTLEFRSQIRTLWAIRPSDGPWFSALPATIRLTVRQTDRRLADPFLRRGLDPLLSPVEPQDAVVVFATKHRDAVLADLALAVERLREGGMLLVSAANDLGAASLERCVRSVMGNCTAFSKQKCRVLTSSKASPLLDQDTLSRWALAGEIRPQPGTGLYACPGVFSWRAPDAGSLQLADFLPNNLVGRGADFGAGYGFLTAALLKKNPGIEEIHLIEVEQRGILASERGLRGSLGYGPDRRPRLFFEWRDLTGGSGLSGLDFVVTNPPFHQERGSLPLLGQQFIREGLRALRPGGRFFMVANRQLPYEETLEQAGARTVRTGGHAGFKLIEAQAPPQAAESLCRSWTRFEVEVGRGREKR